MNNFECNIVGMDNQEIIKTANESDKDLALGLLLDLCDEWYSMDDNKLRSMKSKNSEDENNALTKWDDVLKQMATFYERVKGL